MAGRYAQGAAAQERVRALVRCDLQLAAPAVQILVGCVAARGLERVTARGIRGVTHTPFLTTRPICWHPLFPAARIADDRVEFDIVEWIFVAETKIHSLISRAAPRRDCAETAAAAAPNSKLRLVSFIEPPVRRLRGA